jgi:O-antigen/teichoic acid export membrane protein
VSNLGKDGYGVWSLIGAAISFLTLTNLGAANSVGRFVSRSRGEGDNHGLKALLSTALGLLMAMGVLVALVTLALAHWIPGWLGLGVLYQTAGRWVFVISGMTLALQFPLRIGTGVLEGYQRYGSVNGTEIVKTALNVSGILLLLAIDQIRLVPLALLVSSATLVQYILLTLMAYRTAGGLRLDLGLMSLPVAKEIASLSLSAFVMTMSRLLYRSGLTLIVGKILGIAQAGIYGVALVVMTHLSSLLSHVTRSLTTLASELEARGETKRLQHLANLVMRVTFALSTGLAIGLVFYGEPVLRLLLYASDWTDSDFASARTALSIMGLGLAIGAPQLSSRSILQGVGQHWQVAIGFLFASVCALVVGGVAMANGAGLRGAALGWGLVLTIQGVILYPPMVCRFLNQSAWRMIVHAYLPGGGVGMAVWGFAAIMSRWLPPTQVLPLAVNLICCTAIGLIGTVIVAGKMDFVRGRVQRLVGF